MIAYWFNRLADVLDEEASSLAAQVEASFASKLTVDEHERIGVATVTMVFGALAVVLRKVGGEQR